MARRVELVCFDCDGVLVDTEPIARAVDARVSAALGIPLTVEEATVAFRGLSDRQVMLAFEQRSGQDLGERWSEEFARWYEEALKADLRMVDGIGDLLDALALPMCVVSNSRPERISWKLAHVGLLDRFAGRIFSAVDVRRPKPAPDVYLYAAQVAGFDPGGCLAVEDSPVGLASAQAAGLQAAVFDPSDTMRLDDRTAVVRSPSELLAYIVGGEPTPRHVSFCAIPPTTGQYRSPETS